MLDEVNFTKMQTGGNDYIYFDCFHNDIRVEQIKPYIKYLCDRHFGIGGDGVIFILPSTLASAKMIMYNKDGTESSMCTSGILSVAKYLYESKIANFKNITVETKAGVKPVSLAIENGIIRNISIRMGEPNFNPRLVPVLTDQSLFVNQPIQVAGNNYITTCVSVGNPHAVIYTEDIQIDLNRVGPAFSCHYLFPEGVNVDFISKIDNQKIELKTWERGSGETLSSGSGACAAVAALVFGNVLAKNTKITVLEPGGTQYVEYNDRDGMILSGDVKRVYDGKVLLKRRI